MTEVIDVAVPRKGRPLEAVLSRVAEAADCADLADDISTTLRFEKAIATGDRSVERGAYERLREYSDPDDETAPDYTLLRDARPGTPRRIVFDSVTVPFGDVDLRLIGREEPFRSLRKHEVPLGFDSADLVLEEVVELRPDPLRDVAELNDRIDPRDTDVRVVSGLGDTVYHSLMARPDVIEGGDLDRAFVREYEGEMCISPRYERLVEAVLGTDAIGGIEFVYPGDDVAEEEAAIAATGLGVYLTVTGGTAREHGLVLGEDLFPSETVLLENTVETSAVVRRAIDRLVSGEIETAIPAE